MAPGTTVNVPSTWPVGMQYLNELTTSAPFYSSLARNWDQKNGTMTKVLHVRGVCTSAGVYDWESFDLFFTQNAGKKIIFTLGVPADFMISRAALGGSAYGGKSNMVPTGTTELDLYMTGVAAMVNRAKNTFGVTGIIFEAWNEAANAHFCAAAERPALGPYYKRVRTELKAIDPTCVILCPSWLGGMYGPDGAGTNLLWNGSSFIATGYRYLLTLSDGAGGFLGDHCDGLSLHVYGVGAWGFKSTIDFTKQAAINAGYPALADQVYLTESGTIDYTPGQELDFGRRIMVCAAQGVKCFDGYALGYTQNGGIADYADEWNYAVGAVRGKTITRCIRNPDESVTLTADGRTFTL